VRPEDHVIVRAENTEDPEERSVIHSINEAAFDRPDEADLVDSLRNEGVVLVSLVAELDQQVVGHILFSRMSIETTGSSVPAAALAPMAVFTIRALAFAVRRHDFSKALSSRTPSWRWN